VGVAGYQLIEGWGFLDSLWMVVISLTTIGFGEVHPLSDAGRVFTLLLIICGLSVTTYYVTTLSRFVLEGELMRVLERRRRKRSMANWRDHYIVVGHGNVGGRVVRQLTDSGARVCIIEREEDVAEALRSEGVAVIHGDGSHDDVLRQAGLDHASGVAVTTGSMAEGILITLSARQLNPTVPIVTQVTSDEGAVKARRAGATSVVSPEIMGGWRIANGLARPHTSTFLDLALLADNDALMLDEFEVGPGLSGHTLQSLDISGVHRVLVVAIRKPNGQMEVAPGAGSRVSPDDVLIVVGCPENVRSLGRSLRAQGKK